MLAEGSFLSLSSFFLPLSLTPPSHSSHPPSAPSHLLHLFSPPLLALSSLTLSPLSGSFPALTPFISLSSPRGGTTNYDKMNRDSPDICWRVDSIEGIHSVVAEIQREERDDKMRQLTTRSQSIPESSQIWKAHESKKSEAKQGSWDLQTLLKHSAVKGSTWVKTLKPH